MSDTQNSKGSEPPNKDTDSNNDDETVKSYYYDDSTGYETYHAEDDMENDEDVSEPEPRPTER